MRKPFGASMAVTLRRWEQGGQYQNQHHILVRNGCFLRRRHVTARFLCCSPGETPSGCLSNGYEPRDIQTA